MPTVLKFFIPVIYFDVHKKCNDMQVHLDGMPGALTARGNQHASIVLPSGHMPLQWVCWSDGMAHVGPRQPEGGGPDPFSSTACNEIVPRGSVPTFSICRISVNSSGLVGCSARPRCCIGPPAVPSFAQDSWVSSTLDGRPVVTLLNLLARVVAKF